MGKYMRKSKATGEVAVMEVSHSQASSLGVRTRAKTLALQRSSAAPPVTSSASGSYLQLRSRRLEKPPILLPKRLEPRKQKQSPKEGCSPHNPNSKATSNSRASSRLGVERSVAESQGQNAEEAAQEMVVANKEEESREKNDHNNISNNENGGDLGLEEASFGENVLEFEGRERTTRESTPCSLIRDPEIIRTPGSTTRPTNSSEANRRIQNPSLRHIPTAHEMDEFFAGAEEEQQKKFIEKYNFDPMNDKPLSGRYEWEKVDP